MDTLWYFISQQASNKVFPAIRQKIRISAGKNIPAIRRPDHNVAHRHPARKTRPMQFIILRLFNGTPGTYIAATLHSMENCQPSLEEVPQCCLSVFQFYICLNVFQVPFHAAEPRSKVQINDSAERMRLSEASALCEQRREVCHKQTK